MTPNRVRQIYLFFLISVLSISCSNKKDVDVSGIKLDIKIERFDKDLDRLSPANLPGQTAELKKKYGVFYTDFMERIINVGNTQDTSYFPSLRMVLTNKDYRELKSAVAQTFPDLSVQETEINDAFKHILYYYPNQKIPRLISYFSGFAYQIATGDNYIGIGLDMFLGADSKFYPALRATIPAYISNRYTPENISPRVLEAFIRTEMFPEPEGANSLLAKMIYNGKIMYMMDAAMPGLADSLKIGYTTRQDQWCRDYEPGIWGYFLEQNLLFETDYMKIQQYLTEAPFTPGVGEKNESAPKLGIWLGWQIVKHYMDNNQGATLQQLIKETDYQKILNQSKYKPK